VDFVMKNGILIRSGAFAPQRLPLTVGADS
jgi:hypothetical protein